MCYAVYSTTPSPKPCDAQFLASISQIRVWRLTDILLGAGVLIAALIYRGLDIGPREALAFAFVLCTGGSIIYSFWLMLATLTFWFLRIENILHIFQSMYEAGRWPIGIYPHWLRYILTFLVPVAFAITVPAEALSGRLTPESNDHIWPAVRLSHRILALVLETRP